MFLYLVESPKTVMAKPHGMQACTAICMDSCERRKWQNLIFSLSRYLLAPFTFLRRSDRTRGGGQRTTSETRFENMKTADRFFFALICKGEGTNQVD